MTGPLVALIAAVLVLAAVARTGVPLGRVGTWLLAVTGIALFCATGVAMVLIVYTGTAPG